MTMPTVTEEEAGLAAESRPANITTDDRDRLHDENLRLVNRIARLRIALEALTKDNAELRRTLAQVRLQQRRLTAPMETRPLRLDRATRGRTLLRDRASRNP
jgi:hypothetical protein